MRISLALILIACFWGMVFVLLGSSFMGCSPKASIRGNLCFPFLRDNELLRKEKADLVGRIKRLENARKRSESHVNDCVNVLSDECGKSYFDEFMKCESELADCEMTMGTCVCK